jgi:hypothetical protein
MIDEGYSLFYIAHPDIVPLEIGQFVDGELIEVCRQVSLDSADIFLPVDWHNPIFNDGPAPGFVVQLCARDAGQLGELQTRLSEVEMRDTGRLSSIARSGIFATHSWPVAGQAAPAARAAPVSFLVRYFADMLPDADAFRAAYQASHPAILGRFPGIRNVRCYVPHDTSNETSIELLNEVVFDSTDALGAALASDVLQALREDTATLPERGENAHHAMQRLSVG